MLPPYFAWDIVVAQKTGHFAQDIVHQRNVLFLSTSVYICSISLQTMTIQLHRFLCDEICHTSITQRYCYHCILVLIVHTSHVARKHSTHRRQDDENLRDTHRPGTASHHRRVQTSDSLCNRSAPRGSNCGNECPASYRPSGEWSGRLGSIRGRRGCAGVSQGAFNSVAALPTGGKAVKRYIIIGENSNNQDAPGVAIWHSKEVCKSVADMLSRASNAKMAVVELPE